MTGHGSPHDVSEPPGVGRLREVLPRLGLPAAAQAAHPAHSNMVRQVACLRTFVRAPAPSPARCSSPGRDQVSRTLEHRHLLKPNRIAIEFEFRGVLGITAAVLASDSKDPGPPLHVRVREEEKELTCLHTVDTSFLCTCITRPGCRDLGKKGCEPRQCDLCISHQTCRRYKQTERSPEKECAP